VKLGSLRNDKLFTAWLKRIVVNHCLNALKAQKQLQLKVEEYEEESESDETYHEMRVQQVLGALDHISAGCRTVLNLYVFEGYDHSEIAQILNISESASKAQYSKAKSKIRSLLNTDKKNGTGFI
jgi:RNA polymerase sigma-70 factor (ECF subfamily)